MPNITEPASLDYAEGQVRVSRLVPAKLSYRSGNIDIAKSSTLSLEAVIPQLDRLRREDGADYRFQLIWQRTMEAVEQAFVAVNNRVDEVALIARLNTVEQLASAANDNAIGAEQKAEATLRAVEETFDQIDPIYSKFYQLTLEEDDLGLD